MTNNVQRWRGCYSFEQFSSQQPKNLQQEFDPSRRSLSKSVDLNVNCFNLYLTFQSRFHLNSLRLVTQDDVTPPTRLFSSLGRRHSRSHCHTSNPPTSNKLTSALSFRNVFLFHSTTYTSIYTHSKRLNRSFAIPTSSQCLTLPPPLPSLPETRK